ncbi:MAG: hypothetical protein AAGJ37_04910 [Pseudomonadota bacterium]
MTPKENRANQLLSNDKYQSELDHLRTKLFVMHQGIKQASAGLLKLNNFFDAFDELETFYAKNDKLVEQLKLNIQCGRVLVNALSNPKRQTFFVYQCEQKLQLIHDKNVSLGKQMGNVVPFVTPTKKYMPMHTYLD